MNHLRKGIIYTGLGLSLFVGMASVNSEKVSAESQPQISDNLVSADSNSNVDRLLQNDSSQMSTKKDADLYAQPNKDSKKLQGLNKFTPVKFEEKQGNWYRVNVNNQSGYIKIKDVVQVANDKGQSRSDVQIYVSKKTNGYSKPDKYSKQVQTLDKFTHVEFKKQSGKWMKVKVNNQKMYVPAKGIVQVSVVPINDGSNAALY